MENCSKYLKTFNSICRLCLNNNDIATMVPLVKNNGPSVYGEMLTTFTNISVNQEDNLPTNICHKCRNVLDRIESFKSACQNNQKRMKNLMNLCLQKRNSKADIIKTFCEYIIFCQYFPQDEEMPRKVKKHTQTVVKHGISKLSSEKPQYTDKSNVSMANTAQDIKIEFQPSTSTSDCTSETENDMQFNNSITESDKRLKDQKNDEIDNLMDTMETYYTKQHIKSESKKQPSINPEYKPNLTCHICNRTLANRSTYKHHMERHGDCKFVCECCGRAFPVLAELTRHLVARHGVTNSSVYKCDQCSFEAALKFELIEHIRIHTGERPFTCEKCGLTFRRQAIWRQHLKIHEEKTVQCNLCSKKFYNRGQMLAHRNNVHERVYLYLCRICEVSYAKTETVRKHMTIKHGIPREEQGKIVRISKGSMSTPIFNDRKT